MRAAVLHEANKPLVIENVDVKKPGPHEVLVRVHANALNFRDLNVLKGSYRVKPRGDVIPLSDGAGDVVAIGARVSRVKMGDRVAGAFFQKWIGGRIMPEHLRSDLGGSLDGMLSEKELTDLVAYLRFVGRQVLLVLLLLGLVVVEAISYLRFEWLLTFLTAGFVVQNFSRQGEKLLHGVEHKIGRAHV